VWKKHGETSLSQSKYTIDVIFKFGMLNCKSMTTPMISNLKKLLNQATGSDPEDPSFYRQIIGSVMYLVYTRLDICYAVNSLSHFMCEPKHILRYVWGTISYGLRYTSIRGVIIHGYTDSDWMDNTVDWKSTSRYCFSLGSAVISWSSRKQASIAQITTETEYIFASVASKEAVLLINLLSYLFNAEFEPIVIDYDKQRFVKFSMILVFFMIEQNTLR
jgi:hypothetical protein